MDMIGHHAVAEQREVAERGVFSEQTRDKQCGRRRWRRRFAWHCRAASHDEEHRRRRREARRAMREKYQERVGL